MAQGPTVDIPDLIELTFDGLFVDKRAPVLDLNPAEACQGYLGFCGGCNTCQFMQASHAGYQSAELGLLTIQFNSWEISCEEVKA